jgi:hypothetical protein
MVKTVCFIFVVCYANLLLMSERFIVVCVFCHAGNIVKESGPVSMTFTIPMYTASRLQVKT